VRSVTSQINEYDDDDDDDSDFVRLPLQRYQSINQFICDKGP